MIIDKNVSGTLTGRLSKPLYTPYDTGTNNRELQFSRCRRLENFA